MREVLMSPKEIQEEIKWEDKCMINTLLQNLIHFKEINQKVEVFKVVKDNGSTDGYVIRDAVTHKDVQL